MTEYDYWKIFPRMPRKVEIGDITIRDGFQHCEKFISTQAKIFYGQEMILAGGQGDGSDQSGIAKSNAPVQ